MAPTTAAHLKAVTRERCAALEVGDTDAIAEVRRLPFTGSDVATVSSAACSPLKAS
jgi:hypothetical protein